MDWLLLFMLGCGGVQQPLFMPGSLGPGTCTELQTGLGREAVQLLQPPGWGVPGQGRSFGQRDLVRGS